MTDIADRAADAQQRQINEAIEVAKKQKIKQLQKGRCNYCNEPVTGYFCDTDCRDDYDHEQRLKAQHGRLIR